MKIIVNIVNRNNSRGINQITIIKILMEIIIKTSKQFMKIKKINMITLNILIKMKKIFKYWKNKIAKYKL